VTKAGRYFATDARKSSSIISVLSFVALLFAGLDWWNESRS
jgi:hypothetical protein